MKTLESPFLSLHSQLEKIIYSGVRGQSGEEIVTFCCTQVRLLHILYSEMQSTDIGALGVGRFDIDKGRFDYCSFIYVLNQFGRILQKEYKEYDINLPLYNRIRFFRNKVAEHWDDYAKNLSGVMIRKELGKPLIPTIRSVFLPDELALVKKGIEAELHKFHITLELDEFDWVNNAEKIYLALESIDSELNTKTDKKYLIPNALVDLLFKFGFPPPILDVKSYSEELVEQIVSKLNLRVENPAE